MFRLKSVFSALLALSLATVFLEPLAGIASIFGGAPVTAVAQQPPLIADSFDWPVGAPDGYTTISDGQNVIWDLCGGYTFMQWVPVPNDPSGRYYFHPGQDLNWCGRSDTGRPVYAIGNGIVVEVYRDYGTMLVEHTLPTDVKVWANYKHVSPEVSVGTRVVKGQRIGAISGNHLHFEIRLKAPGDGFHSPYMPVGQSKEWIEQNYRHPTFFIERNRKIVYRIQSLNSGKVADVWGGSLDDWAWVVQWPWHGGANQRWYLEALSGPDQGYYRLRSLHSDKCMDVEYGSTEAWAPIIQYACHDGDDEKWELIREGNNQYVIRNKRSGKVLDTANASTESGARLIQYWWHSGLNERWRLDYAGLTGHIAQRNLYVNPSRDLTLEVCGINLHQDIYVHAWRDGRDFGIRSVRVEFGTTLGCITVNDLDGDGPVLGNTTYFTGVSLWPGRTAYEFRNEVNSGR